MNAAVSTAFICEEPTARHYVSQIGAAPHLKIFLLARGPCLYVHGLHFEIRQISRAALKGPHRNLHGTEQIYCVLPQFVVPFHTVLRFTYNDHFLLFKLMYAVYSSLLDAVRTFLLAETRRIASQCLRKLVFCKLRVNEFPNHRVFTCTDKIKILSFDLVHHGIHLCETHHTCHHIAPDHKRGNAVCEASAYHKVTGIRNHCRVKSGDIPHQIIEAVSRYFSCTVKINTIKGLHDICVIRDLKIRNCRLTKSLDLYVLTVVFPDRHRRINDIWNRHHNLFDLFFYFFLLCGKLVDSSCAFCHLFLKCFCFFKFLLSHHGANFFGGFIFLSSK